MKLIHKLVGIGLILAAAAVLFAVPGMGSPAALGQMALAGVQHGISETVTLGPSPTTTTSTEKPRTETHTTTTVAPKSTTTIKPATTEPPHTTTTFSDRPVTTLPIVTTTTIHTTEPPHSTEPPHPTTTTVKPTPTTEPHKTTTTTTKPSPTTTVPANNVQSMSLSCSGGPIKNAPTVSCAWTPSTSSTFGYYQLLRWTGTGESGVVVATITGKSSTTATDNTVTAGGNYSYAIVAYDIHGAVVGYSKHISVTTSSSTAK